MANAFEVETRVLKGDYTHLEEQIKKCETDLLTLQETFRVLNSMWSGKANMAYRKTVRSDIHRMTQAISIMRRMLGSLNEAGMKYEKTEQKLKDEIESLKL